jgi:hypothetical protein
MSYQQAERGLIGIELAHRRLTHRAARIRHALAAMRQLARAHAGGPPAPLRLGMTASAASCGAGAAPARARPPPAGPLIARPALAWHLTASRVCRSPDAEGTRRVPQKAPLRRDAGAPRRRCFVRRRRGAGRPLRRARAPRPPLALGPAPRARRRARLVGDPERDPRRSQTQPQGGPRRGPSARLHRLPRHDPGRIRRRRGDDLGQRHLHVREVAAAQSDRRLRRRATERPLRAVPRRQNREGLDDPPHGSAAGRHRERAAGRRRADARAPLDDAERRGPMGVRDQVGRRARDRALAARAPQIRHAQRQRRLRRLSGAARAQPRARLAQRNPRRRDRRVQRARQAELPGAAAAHPPAGRGGRETARGADARHLRDLRPAVARRSLVDGPALHGAPQAPRGTEARRRALARPRPPRGERQRAARSHVTHPAAATAAG